MLTQTHILSQLARANFPNFEQCIEREREKHSCHPIDGAEGKVISQLDGLFCFLSPCSSNGQTEKGKNKAKEGA